MTTGEQIITLDVDSHESVSSFPPQKTLTFLILRFASLRFASHNHNVLLL